MLQGRGGGGESEGATFRSGYASLKIPSSGLKAMSVDNSVLNTSLD